MVVKLALENILNTENIKVFYLLEIVLILVLIFVLCLAKNRLARLAVDIIFKVFKSESDYKLEVKEAKANLERPVSWMIFSGVTLLLIPLSSVLSANMYIYNFFMKLFQTIFIIARTYVVIILLDLFIRIINEKRKNKNSYQDYAETAGKTPLFYLGVIIKAVLIILAGLEVFKLWSDSKGNILAGIVISIIVAVLVLRDAVANLIAGLTILLQKPFDVGDWIETNAKSGFVAGRVENIGLLSSNVRSDDGTIKKLPNSEIVNNFNVSNDREERSSVIKVPISINTSSDKMEEFKLGVTEILGREEYVLRNIKVSSMNFNDLAYIYDIRFTTNLDYEKHILLKKNINTKIDKLLKDLEIETSKNTMYKLN